METNPIKQKEVILNTCPLEELETLLGYPVIELQKHQKRLTTFEYKAQYKEHLIEIRKRSGAWQWVIEPFDVMVESENRLYLKSKMFLRRDHAIRDLRQFLFVSNI